MTEDQLEQEALGWLGELGYQHLYGPDIAHDGDNLPLRCRGPKVSTAIRSQDGPVAPLRG